MDEVSAVSTSPTQDERILAAAAHISHIIPYAGIIATIVIWVTQKDKSKYVAFQAVQALAYQIVVFMGLILGVFCYMASGIAMVFSAPFSRGGGGFPTFFIFPFTVISLIMVLWLASILYAIVAAVMALQGKDFRYAVLGRRLEEYLNK